MTKASEGLRLKPRAESDLATSLAAANAEDILANLPDATRASLASALAAEAAPVPVDDEDEDGDKSDEAKGKKVGGAEASADVIEKARAEGFKAGTERAVAVITHDDFGGRASAAAKLLGNQKLASLSADEVVEMLADKPDDGAAAMLEALKGNARNPLLGNDGGEGADAAKANNHGWGKAAAKINARFGAKA